MTQKIIDASEIDALQRFDDEGDYGVSIHYDGDFVKLSHIRALLEKAPSVSGEAAAYICEETRELTFDPYEKTHSVYKPLYTTPQPDRVAELEATNKKLASWANILATQCAQAGIKITIEGKDVKQAIAEAEGK